LKIPIAPAFSPRLLRLLGRSRSRFGQKHKSEAQVGFADFHAKRTPLFDVEFGNGVWSTYQSK